MNIVQPAKTEAGMAEIFPQLGNISREAEGQFLNWYLPEATFKADFLADTLAWCTFVAVTRAFPDHAALPAFLGPLGTGCWSV